MDHNKRASGASGASGGKERGGKIRIIGEKEVGPDV